MSSAAKCQPENAEGHYILGLALQQDGDHNGAIAEFRESIRLDPANSGAHYNLARALTKTGDTNSAATEFAQVRSIQQADRRRYSGGSRPTWE